MIYFFFISMLAYLDKRTFIMQPRIPLPTDNIYKFYALFGMFLLLVSGTLFFVRHQHNNELAYERYILIETLKKNERRTAEEDIRFFVLQEAQKIAKNDKYFEVNVTLSVFFLGCILSFLGFYYWHTTIQPKQDKLLDLQIIKIKKELKALDKANRVKPFSERK